MKIEDCKVGMKVKSVADRDLGVPGVCLIKNGDILTISKIHEKDGKVNFEEINYLWLIEHFELANKFEIGDEVMLQSVIVKIWGKRYDEEKKKYQYAVNDEKSGWSVMIFEDSLSPFKKKDELEVGDNFIDNLDKKDEMVIVLAKEYDEFRGNYRYFGKYIDSKIVDVWNDSDIKEIIYN